MQAVVDSKDKIEPGDKPKKKKGKKRTGYAPRQVSPEQMAVKQKLDELVAKHEQQENEHMYVFSFRFLKFQTSTN